MSRSPEQKLWDNLRKHTSDLVDWTRIETGATTQGVPDLDAILKALNSGLEFKLELKVCVLKGYKTSSLWRPMQIAWQQRRTSLGGRVWNLVHHPASSSLYLYHGTTLRYLATSSEFIEPALKTKDDGAGYRQIISFIANHGKTEEER
jgi:hypothetical protein